MPATYWTQWCNYCHGYRSAWTNDHRRCYSCDNWTMSCHHGCHGCCDHGTSEALKNAENRNSSLSTENTNLHNQLASKSVQVAEKEGQIVAINKDLANTQSQLTKTEGELTVAIGKAEELSDLLTNLKIESNNKDKEIEIKTNDVRNLKAELEKSQEENFERKLKEQENKWNEFVQKLGIGREKPRELRNAYRQLIRVRENYNQDNIDEAEDKIEDIKDELLSSGWIQKGMSAENVKKLCSKCEKIAKLKVEQGKMQQQKRQQQQQYQAHQEQPTNNN